MDSSSYSSSAYRPVPPPPQPPPGVSPLAAFKFVFASEAPFSTAILLTGLLFIPFIGQIALAGYKADVLQRLVRREANAMPKLTSKDVMPLLSRGVPSFIAELALTMVGMFPFVFLAILLFALAHPPHGVQSVWLLQGAMFGVMLAVFVLIAPIVNAALTRTALTEDLAGALRPRPVLAYARKTWGLVLVTYAVFTVLGMGLALAGMLACFVGVYPAVALGQLAMTHLRWQIYESQLAHGGALIPVKIPAALPAPPMPS
jgi:hypothetical protein